MESLLEVQCELLESSDREEMCVLLEQFDEGVSLLRYGGDMMLARKYERFRRAYCGLYGRMGVEV